MLIVNPEGCRGPTPTASIANRLTDLEGARLAVLDNGKPNADRVVTTAALSLQHHHGVVALEHFSKPVAAKPCPEAVLVQFRGFDAAIVGVGD